MIYEVYGLWNVYGYAVEFDPNSSCDFRRCRVEMIGLSSCSDPNLDGRVDVVFTWMQIRQIPHQSYLRSLALDHAPRLALQLSLRVPVQDPISLQSRLPQYFLHAPEHLLDRYTQR